MTKKSLLFRHDKNTGNLSKIKVFRKQKIMQEMGLEPTRSCDHRHLKPARLPIPPLLHFLFLSRSLATA